MKEVSTCPHTPTQVFSWFLNNSTNIFIFGDSLWWTWWFLCFFQANSRNSYETNAEYLRQASSLQLFPPNPTPTFFHHRRRLCCGFHGLLPTPGRHEKTQNAWNINLNKPVFIFSGKLTTWQIDLFLVDSHGKLDKTHTKIWSSFIVHVACKHVLVTSDRPVMIEKKYQLSSAFPHDNLVDDNKNQQNSWRVQYTLMEEILYQSIGSLFLVSINGMS